MDKGVDVSSAEEYINMSEFARGELVWYWPHIWYIEPSSLPCNFENFGVKGCLSDWEKVKNFLKNEYPVQYFLREEVSLFFGRLNRRFRDFSYPIKCAFFPRNKNYSKLIPNTWQSADRIMESVIIEGFMSNISDETIKCWATDKFSSHWREKAKEARACRKYFAVDREKIKTQMELEWDNLSINKSFKVKYKKVNNLEKKLDDSDTKWLTWIIENRKILD